MEEKHQLNLIIHFFSLYHRCIFSSGYTGPQTSTDSNLNVQNSTLSSSTSSIATTYQPTSPTPKPTMPKSTTLVFLFRFSTHWLIYDVYVFCFIFKVLKFSLNRMHQNQPQKNRMKKNQQQNMHMHINKNRLKRSLLINLINKQLRSDQKQLRSHMQIRQLLKNQNEQKQLLQSRI